MGALEEPSKIFGRNQIEKQTICFCPTIKLACRRAVASYDVENLDAPSSPKPDLTNGVPFYTIYDLALGEKLN